MVCMVVVLKVIIIIITRSIIFIIIIIIIIQILDGGESTISGVERIETFHWIYGLLCLYFGKPRVAFFIRREFHTSSEEGNTRFAKI